MENIKIVVKLNNDFTFSKAEIRERIIKVVDRFPSLYKTKITVTAEMENSPKQAGPDLYTLKFQAHSGIYKDLILKKSAETMELALANLVDYLQERLNRFSDKKRVKKIQKLREVPYSL